MSREVDEATFEALVAAAGAVASATAGRRTFIAVGEGVDRAGAFASACAVAVGEHGDGGYTGTVAEKADTVLMSTNLFPDLATAEDFARAMLGDPRVADPEGPAGAVRFANHNPANIGAQSWLFFGCAAC